MMIQLPKYSLPVVMCAFIWNIWNDQPMYECTELKICSFPWRDTHFSLFFLFSNNWIIHVCFLGKCHHDSEFCFSEFYFFLLPLNTIGLCAVSASEFHDGKLNLAGIKNYVFLSGLKLMSMIVLKCTLDIWTHN